MDTKGMVKLRYGNTNTFFVPGGNGGILFDTDYAGTLRSFYKAIKRHSITVDRISHVMVSHYHPDHMGLVSELMSQGVGLLLIDVQRGFVHFSDRIFERDGLPYTPIDEARATVISCEQSREFLARIGISGEVVRTPSHSEDSVSLVLDDGDCLVGDLEPLEYLAAYKDNAALEHDWQTIRSFHPKRVFYAHAPEQVMEE